MQTSKPTTASNVESDIKSKLRPDLGYAAHRWKRRDEGFRKIAEAQEQMVAADLATGTALLRRSQSKGISNLSREDVLRCFVTMHYVDYTPLSPTDLRALFNRSNQWARELTFEEFYWRTFATWSIAGDPSVIPVVKSISRAVPDDWRTNTVLINALLGDRSTAGEAIQRARRLVTLYPKHAGTILVLADALTVRAYQLRDPKLLDQSDALVERARASSTTTAEKRRLAEAEGSIAYYRKNGFGR